MHPTARSLVLLSALLCSVAASADSPVTSTPFSDAYMEDYPIVRDALESGVMTAELAAYLADENNPVDVKMAVINALGWDFDGKMNAGLYLGLRYPEGPELSPEDLSGEECLVVGYLALLDDYFHPAEALPWLSRARQEMPQSFTAAVIHALCQCQIVFDESVDRWQEVWTTFEAVLEDDSLNGDMRLGAVRIIADYLALYQDG